jgi:hypothetical protein
MTGNRVAFLGIVAAAVMGSLPATAAEQPRAVIELFTSQGCSSCPKADKLIGELSKDPTVIALSLAIDYWDYLGWKDTLALPGHANRQKAYSKVRGDRQIYTPQAVVNGAAQALGSDPNDIERAVRDSRRNAAILTLPMTLAIANGAATFSVPAGKTGAERGEVWLCPVSKSVSVAIGRGENNGRTITYTNVVRRWVKVSDWNGAAATWSVPVKDFKTDGVDAVAVIVQSGVAASPGPMFSASFAQLR